VSDITYVATKEGFVYLHLVTDAYSKQIMGYCLSKDLSATNTIAALQMALKQRKYSIQLIHHSDRGLQYCSAAYVNLLLKNNIEISMTQDGNPYDNAIAERVNGILKDEFGLDEIIENLEQAVKLTDEAVSLYNTTRPHLSCSMLTPVQMHSQTELKIKRWNKKSKAILEDCPAFIPLNHYQ
jgi:transposase InsO family protein